MGRISLRNFLILCLVCGTAIGLYVRWRFYQDRYWLDSTVADGFSVRSMWLKMDGHEELVYLIAYPDGNLYGGGATCNPNSPPGTHGVHLHPAGLHVYGERQDGECFVYTNSGRGGARLVQSEVRLTKQEFKSLGQTKLWKDHLRPALLEESQRFDQWYLETRGSPKRPVEISSEDENRFVCGERRQRQSRDDLHLHQVHQVEEPGQSHHSWRAGLDHG